MVICLKATIIKACISSPLPINCPQKIPPNLGLNVIEQQVPSM